MKLLKMDETLKFRLLVAAVVLTLAICGLFWFAYSDRLIVLAFLALVISLVIVGVIVSKRVLSNRKDRSPLMLFTLICSGLLYMAVFTPFTVPDEVYHFQATYCLSNALMGEGYQGDPVEMRVEDAELVSELSPTLKVSDYDAVMTGLGESSISGQTTEVSTGSSFDLGSNPPQIRIVSALGITLARLLNLGPYYLIYLGRLFNLAFYICLAYLAYRITPVGKNIFAVVMLLPMTQHLAASYSYDAGILGLSFLVTALVIRALYRTDEFTLREGVEIVLAVAMLAPCKVIYSLIAVAALFIPSSRFKSRHHEIAVKAGCFAAVAAFVLITRIAGIVSVSGAVEGAATSLDYRGAETGYFYTIGDVIASPIKFILMYLRTFDNLGSFYLLTMVGSSLGWFQAEIEMPTFMAVALILLLVMSMIRTDDDKAVLPTPVRVAGVAIFFVGSIAAMASMLLGWTFNTEQLIMGVQGRYFLPYLPLLLLGLRPAHAFIKANMNSVLILSVSVINAINLIRIFSIALTL